MKKVTLHLLKILGAGENYRILTNCGIDAVGFNSNTKKSAYGVFIFVKKLLGEMDKLNCSASVQLVYESACSVYRVMAELQATKDYLMFSSTNKDLAEAVKDFIQDVVKLTEE